MGRPGATSVDSAQRRPTATCGESKSYLPFAPASEHQGSADPRGNSTHPPGQRARRDKCLSAKARNCRQSYSVTSCPPDRTW
jgi:hypothetical protein